MAANTLSPFVYWGQTLQTVSLKVDLRSVENIECTLTEEGLGFSADGLGVKGLNRYGFDLQFYLPVNPEKSKYRRTDIAVEYQIEKTAPESWPRLTAEKIKLPWLKIDFDKFLLDDSEGSNSENDEQCQNETIDKITTSLGVKPRDELPSLKQSYLLLYNLFQFIGFAFVVIGLLSRFFMYGHSATETAFEAVGTQMMVCQTVATLEVIHSVIGIVKSNAFITLAQMIGRNFTLFVLMLQEPRLQVSPLCWCLFLTWSAIEIIRYPYYMFQILGKEMRWLTWLRYTAWIPLYPVGIVIELLVVISSMTYFGETEKLSLDLPNHANFAFYFPYFLLAYVFVMVIGGSNNLKYMYLQRKKQMALLYGTAHSNKNGKSKTS